MNGRSTCRYTESRQASLIAREHNYMPTLAYVRYSIYFNIRDAPESVFTDFNNSGGDAAHDPVRQPLVPKAELLHLAVPGADRRLEV